LNGTIAFVQGAGENPSSMQLAWADASARVETAGAPPHHIHDLQLSPDGTQAAFTVLDGGPDVYTFDLRRRTLQRLTFDKHSSAPVFTADGKRVIYSSFTGMPPANLWSKSADGSGEATRLTENSHPQSPTSTSSDGETLLYTQLGSRKEIYMLSLQGDPKPRPWLATPFDEDQAIISPDGKFVAYVSDESGMYQVYVRPLSGGGKWQISSGDSGAPQWSRDGRKLFFVVQRKTVMSANVDMKHGFTADVPRVLFEVPDFSHSGYSVGAGGKLFWARSDLASAKADVTITRVIENFDLEVARRVSAQGKSTN
jgi:Tol biopolymer transport system component